MLLIAAGSFTGVGQPAPTPAAANATGQPAVSATATAPGLSTAGNQLLQQGADGVDGTPESHELVPTGGQAGSFRTRGDAFGASMAVGDFNDDGLDDLAVAAPDEDAAEENVDESTPYEDLDEGHGAVHVIYGSQTEGRLSATVYPDQVWTEENDGRPETSRGGVGNQFGAALAAGDFDGDGVDDLAIGAPENGGGDVVVLYGVSIWGSSQNGGLTADGSQHFDQNTPGMEGGVESGDRFGHDLAVGRFDEDSVEDLAIGVPGEDDDAGAVAVVYGAAGGGLSPYHGPGDQLLWQGHDGMAGAPEGGNDFFDTEGDNFGFSLAAGDFDGNGEDDLAIGVPLEIGENGRSGDVAVVYSDQSGLNPHYRNELWYQDVEVTSSGVTRTVAGVSEGGDRFGYALAAGNFGWDHRDDLAIGVPGEDREAGAVAVIAGGPRGLHLFPFNDVLIDQNSPGMEGGREGNTLRGGDEFGYALEAAALGGDLHADLAIGVPGEDDYSGAVAVVYGGDGAPAASNGPGDQLFWQGSDGVAGDAESSDMFGSALAAGDFDENGADDLAIGAPIEDDHAGAVNVLYADSPVEPPADDSPPVVTWDVSGTRGNGHWFVSDVTVTWTYTDPDSAVTVHGGCTPTTVDTDTAVIRTDCSVASAGGWTTGVFVFKRDATPPDLSATLSTPGGGGVAPQRWVTEPVTVSFTCTDSTAGIAECPADRTLTTDADDHVVTGTAVDVAGNDASVTVGPIRIDTTAPDTTVDVEGYAVENGGVTAGEPVELSLAATDATSGVSRTEYAVDGGAWTEYAGQFTVASEGTYTVAYRSVDAAGNVGPTETVDVTVDTTAPVADPGTDQRVDEDDVVAFDGTASTDAVGITSYAWDLGDGATATGATPTHTYEHPGRYTVTLDVTDTVGNVGTDTFTVTVRDATAPSADAGRDLVVDEDAAVSLDGSDSWDNVGVRTYAWDFGDGATSTGTTPTHTYTDPGTYDVTLTVTDERGFDDADSITVTVNDATPPSAEAGGDQAVDEDTTVAFDGATSTDNVGITGYEWDFGDGESATGPAATHTYAESGTYTATLTVTDDAGNVGTDTATVRVAETYDRVVLTDESTIRDAVDLPPDATPTAAERVTIPDTQPGTPAPTFTGNVSVASIRFDGDVEGTLVVVEFADPTTVAGDVPGQPVAAFQISGSASVEAATATARFRVSLDDVRRAGAAVTDLQVAHRRDGRWELLDTTVVSHDADTVVLEATTDGFSPFAVIATAPPQAAMSTVPTTVTAGEVFTLDASDSSTPYGELVSYEWAVDGQSLTGETTTLTLDEPGEYTVELRVTNDADRTALATTTVVVATDTSTDETTAAGTQTDQSDDPTTGPTTTATGPGFGVVIALLALLTTALVPRRQRR